MSLTELHLRAARARVAAAILPSSVDPRLGSVTLWPDQCATAARVERALARDGGCVLADDVGRGKTFVALAVARRWTRPLAIVPAALRTTWADAMRRSGVSCDLVSHEALSRGAMPSATPDGIIMDESHRFRSSSTRRYAMVAALSGQAQMVLMSATPLQNRARDLAAQVALFLGARAFGLDDRALAAFVVRGGSAPRHHVPVVAPARWVRPVTDDGAVLEAILALPSPARAADAGDAGVLRTIALVRAWASTRAALRAMLRRRRRVAAAIEQSVSDGLVPTTRELRAWHAVDDAVQLGFAPMLVHGRADSAAAADLVREVALEHAALTVVEAAMSAHVDPDDARADALRRIRSAHAGERVLAFTELASSARGYYSALCREPGVGLLTAHDARIASGRLSRDDLLARFAPLARGVRPPPERERVTLLVATDLLSEGLNLQDASVVVHLDLPWNPARLAQRVGRLRRPGGAAVVHCYLVAPPARAAMLLDVERRLRAKLADSERTIGRGIDVMPVFGSLAHPSPHDPGHATTWGETLAHVARWARKSRGLQRGARDCPVVAGVASEVGGWLAALDDGRLVASIGRALPVVDASAARAVPLCEGEPRPMGDNERATRLHDCQRWLQAEALRRDCGRDTDPQALDLAIEQKLADALACAPRHERVTVATLAKRLRDGLHRPRPLGAEHALRDVLHGASAVEPRTWIRAATEILASVPPRPPAPESPRIVALILFDHITSDAVATPAPAPAPDASRCATPDSATPD